MRFSREIGLRDFKAWSGGMDTLKEAIEKDLVETIESYINECFYDRTPSETDINDMLWFDEYIQEIVYGIED